MKIVQTILIPTDLSLISPEELKKGVSLVHRSGACRLLLLHTFLPIAAAKDDLIGLNDRLKRGSLDGLALQSAALTPLFPPGEIVVETLSQLGTWENVVPQIVQAEGVSIILFSLNEENQRRIVPRLIGRVSCSMLVLPVKDVRPS